MLYNYYIFKRWEEPIMEIIKVPLTKPCEEIDLEKISLYGNLEANSCSNSGANNGNCTC